MVWTVNPMLDPDHMMDPDLAVDLIPKKIRIKTNLIPALMPMNPIPDPDQEKSVWTDHAVFCMFTGLS